MLFVTGLVPMSANCLSVLIALNTIHFLSTNWRIQYNERSTCLILCVLVGLLLQSIAALLSSKITIGIDYCISISCATLSSINPASTVSSNIFLTYNADLIAGSAAAMALISDSQEDKAYSFINFDPHISAPAAIIIM